MLIRSKPARVALTLVAILWMPAFVSAEVSDLQLPISLDADSTDYDGNNSMLMFRGLRLSQGNIGVEADSGLASKLDFEDSVWQFAGNVRIDTENGQIRCDSADLRFAGHQLRLASIKGSPATFELHHIDSDQLTYAEAGKLEYNFTDGIIEFSDHAKISEGGNQISSNFLVYNIAERRINADSGGNDGEKVKIIYTPGASPGKTATGTATEPESGPDNGGDGAQ